jgi:hypothetical protein
LLANIYLDQLDQFIEQTIIPAYTRGEYRRRNPEWNKAVYKAHYWKKRGRNEEARRWEKAMRQIPYGDPYDPDFRRLRYFRYADDFLLGFVGPRREAQEVKNRLKEFLRDALKLELSEEKTLITHAASQAARFLGYEIVSQHCNTKLDRTGTRSVNDKLALRVPLSVIEAKCGQYMEKSKARHRPELAGEHDFDIVQTYQWQYVGIVNYYLLAQNVGWLHRLRWVGG